jgi:hypothetical protein
MMRMLSLTAVTVLALALLACGDDDDAADDPRTLQIGALSETATGAWASAGPEGLYDYLAASVTGRCPREQLAAALADEAQPTGWRQIKDVEFNGDDEASATVIIITAAGDEESAWTFSRVSGENWRISDLPGLENCGN